jgi:2-methylfumaryl-CoA hydratase
MKVQLSLPPQKELAPSAPLRLDRLRTPQYGRYLDAFVPGQVFVHPRGFTFHPATMLDFARTFMQCCPIYLNAEAARAHGFQALVASPQMVFNVVLSLGVQNDSEKAIANLGYYGARFLRPVLPGDTIRAMTRVVERNDRGGGKPGIVKVQTLGCNELGEVVLQYERKIMVGPAPAGQASALAGQAAPLPGGEPAAFPWQDSPVVDLGQLRPEGDPSLTGTGTYFEDFEPGDVIAHANGRTITDEHVALTYKVGNTHPLHFDRVYSKGLSGAMSGEPIVYGGLVFAWLEGLASRDVSENAVFELGFTEGYHTQPAVSGDTVAAVSRVLAVEPSPVLGDDLGIVTFQLVGVKNLSSAAAVKTYGADLFVKENDKKDKGKDKIPAKIFEIERRLLIKRRPRFRPSPGGP